jgi:rhamnosyltransferase
MAHAASCLLNGRSGNPGVVVELQKYVIREPASAKSKHPGKIGLVVPTLNAGKRWGECLKGIQTQSLRPGRLLVIDSGSTDETVSAARSSGFEIIEIERSQFNHGGTRQWAVEYLDDCEVVVFLTQDAVLAHPHSLLEILGCFHDPRVAVAYGRQLPHMNATAIEAHARIFNYGPSSLKKDAIEARMIGTKVFFCSNSFAAYCRSILLLLGGFRDDLILGEDMEFAGRAVKAGYVNYYCASAEVYHSHDYTVLQTLERYFDLGVFDHRNRWMREEFGSHRGEGLRFITSELQYLARRAPLQIPRAMLQTTGKLVGYKLGRFERFLPKAVKKKLSMMPNYWR